MGHWGTAILSNDTSADIKDTFFSLYDKGKNLNEVRKEIEKQFKEGDSLQDNTDFWLTLALLQWQVGHLDQDVKEYAEKIIDQDLDITVWRESSADEKDLIKRKNELLKLKEKLQTSNLKPRKIKKKILPKSILPKGSVYAFPLKDGNYSAAIVLEEVLNEDYYFALILNTDVYKKELPNLEEVIHSRVLIKPTYQNDNTIRPAIASYTNANHKEIVKSFVKIGDVLIKDNYQKNYLAFGAAPWTFMLDWANMYLVDKKSSSNKIFQVKDYIRSSNSWFKKLFGK